MNSSSPIPHVLILLFCLAAVASVTAGCKEDTSARRGDGGPAELRVKPYPLPPGPGASTITLSWRSGANGTAQVYVSVNGRPEKKVAEGHQGSKEIDWIHPGRDYQFKLYQGEDRQKVLAALAVRKNETPSSGAQTAGHRPGATRLPAPGAAGAGSPR